MKSFGFGEGERRMTAHVPAFRGITSELGKGWMFYSQFPVKEERGSPDPSGCLLSDPVKVRSQSS